MPTMAVWSRTTGEGSGHRPGLPSGCSSTVDALTAPTAKLYRLTSKRLVALTDRALADAADDEGNDRDVDAACGDVLRARGPGPDPRRRAAGVRERAGAGRAGRGAGLRVGLVRGAPLHPRLLARLRPRPLPGRHR